MPASDLDLIDEIRREWTDRHVVVDAGRPELKRFEGMVGRIVTVNYSGKAIVDFCDGAWYDIPASSDFLIRLDPADPRCASHDRSVNGAQAQPGRQS